MNETPKKYPEISVALSFIFPGAGQFYNEEYAKGAILIGATLTAIIFIVYSGISLGPKFVNNANLLRADLIMRIVGTSLIWFGIWLYGMIDGAVGAFKHTLTHIDPPKSKFRIRNAFILLGVLFIIAGIFGVLNLLGVHFQVFIKYSWPVVLIFLGCFILVKSAHFLKGAKK